MKPPPLPSGNPAARGRVFNQVKAFLAIRRIRIAEAGRRLSAWARRRPIVAGLTGTAVVLAVAAGIAVAVGGVPDVELFAPATVADASENARANPNDAAVRRDLGHVQWAAKKRHAAVVSYARALAIDSGVADDATVANLVASFGSKEQREAEALIWKNKLVAAEKGLESLVRSKRYGVRWGAVRTLDRLGVGKRANWETAYILDLDSSDCDLRRTAVDKLGAIGTQRAVSALRAAKADDAKTGGFLRRRCLGDRVETAERRILARR